MVKDGHIFADWELEKLNDLAEYTKQVNIEKEQEELKQKKEEFKREVEESRRRVEESRRKVEESRRRVEESRRKVEESSKECIRNMLKEKLSIELISKVTGKTEEEIISIRNSLE